MIAVNGKTVDAIVEEISATSPDTIFYIGSGSNFFFIGDINDYKADIAKISDGYLESFKRLLERADSDIENGLKPVSFDPNTDKSVDRYEDKLIRISNALKQAKNVKKKLTPYIEKYVPLMQRIPTEVSKKDALLDPKGIMIIVKGIEQGGCWFKSEYERNKNKRGGKTWS